MKLQITVTAITYVSLVAGFLVGFLAQRSRMCFIGGWRDFFLIRDTYLLKGFFAFLFSATLFYFLFDSAGYFLNNYPWFSRPPQMVEVYEFMPNERFELPVQRSMESCELHMYPLVTVGVDIPIRGVDIFGFRIATELLLMLGAAFFLGIFSTLANGCPMRQHVMASSGNVTAICYLLGFYAAVLVYNIYILDFMNSLVDISKQ